MNPAGLLFVAAGIFCASGGIFNWEWFMSHRKAEFMCRILTRTGARIFYIAIGVVLVVMGTLMAMGILQDSSS